MTHQPAACIKGDTMKRITILRHVLRAAIGVIAASMVAVPASAQLTAEQKTHDFENLAGIYAKRYAPHEWKKLLFGFDLLEIGSWLDRAAQSADDLEFFELSLQYVASLDDTHSSYAMPSSFVASLGLAVDIYDNRVVIEAIDRTRLPAPQYPFQVGDALISIDDKSVEDWIAEFSRFFRRANPRSTRRSVADFLTFRPQSRVPRAIDLAYAATVVVEREGGLQETYTLPWVKTGVPLRWIGPVPSPSISSRAVISEDVPAYLEPWLELTNFRLADNDPLLRGEAVSPDGDVVPRRYVLGLGLRSPVFVGALPAGFVQRLGRMATDFHFSGVYEAEGMRIGYLRIPNFAPPNMAAAIAELQTEISFFEQNTDGLVVDVMRNTGGGCYMLNAASYLIPYPFFFFGEEVRVTISRINGIQAALEAALRAGAPPFIIEIYTEMLRKLEDAYRGNRALTEPIPACSLQMNNNEPARDAQGNVAAYTKPLVVLVDEFTISAGDIFAAMLQDNQRGPLVGTRTNGAGGSVSGWPVGTYSEATAGNTNSLVTRLAPLEITGYPTTHYIENVGAHADVRLDYMTRENLLTRGRPFVEAFTSMIVAHIRGELIPSEGSGLPQGWTSGDVGFVGPSGGASYDGTSFRVTGAGADVWDAEDGFQYTYLHISGDVDVVARVSDLVAADGWSKAGLMIRESLAPNAAHYFVAASLLNGLFYQWREHTGETSNYTPLTPGSSGWLRIQRIGAAIRLSISDDGTQWATVAMAPFPPGEALIGLAVTSHDATQTAAATFDNVGVVVR
jgi:peptidase S41-like protein